MTEPKQDANISTSENSSFDGSSSETPHVAVEVVTSQNPHVFLRQHAIEIITRYTGEEGK